jgi:hypothetical protein
MVYIHKMISIKGGQEMDATTIIGKQYAADSGRNKYNDSENQEENLAGPQTQKNSSLQGGLTQDEKNAIAGIMKTLAEITHGSEEGDIWAQMSQNYFQNASLYQEKPMPGFEDLTRNNIGEKPMTFVPLTSAQMEASALSPGKMGQNPEVKKTNTNSTQQKYRDNLESIPNHGLVQALGTIPWGMIFDGILLLFVIIMIADPQLRNKFSSALSSQPVAAQSIQLPGGASTSPVDNNDPRLAFPATAGPGGIQGSGMYSEKDLPQVMLSVNEISLWSGKNWQQINSSGQFIEPVFNLETSLAIAALHPLTTSAAEFQELGECSSQSCFIQNAVTIFRDEATANAGFNLIALRSQNALQDLHVFQVAAADFDQLNCYSGLNPFSGSGSSILCAGKINNLVFEILAISDFPFDRTFGAAFNDLLMRYGGDFSISDH